MKNENVIPDLLHWTTDPAEIQRISLRKEFLFREIIKGAKMTPLPGVLPFLQSLRTAGIPCAIASSTPRENIRCVIDSLAVREFFQATICGEDVTHGKPNPEVFLLAASKLGAGPAQCVVFEDAHVGIAAARKGGMKVVGVATTHPADSLREADRVVQRLDELQLPDLSAWFDRPASKL